MTEASDEILSTWAGWVDDLRRDLLHVHHHRELWESLIDAIATSVSGTAVCTLSGIIP